MDIKESMEGQRRRCRPCHQINANKTTNKIVTQDTLNSAIDEIDAESLGLSKAMRFIGKATAVISDGDKTDPVITGYDFGTNGANAKLGDVIIDKDGLYEYV